MLYTGEFYDSHLGFYYNRARWYNPAVGRFNRLDPFAGSNRDPQSLHKYLYAHCNPIQNVDPSGNISMVQVLSVVTITSTVASIVTPVAGGVLVAVREGVSPWEYISELTSRTTWEEAITAVGLGAVGGSLIGFIAKKLGTKVLSVTAAVFSVYSLIRSIRLTRDMVSGRLSRQDIAHYLAFTTAVVILSALVGNTLRRAATPPREPGIYEFRARSGRIYVGQSENLFRRMQQHLRSGRLRPQDVNTLKWRRMGGSMRTDREIAEQLRIEALGGVGALDNVLNAIGRNRRHLL